MGIHAFFAVLETIVFILSYSVFSKFFDKEFPDAGHIFGSYRWEVGITVLLVFLALHRHLHRIPVPRFPRRGHRARPVYPVHEVE